MTKTEQYKRAAEQRQEDADDAKVTPPRLTWHRESEIKELPDDGDVTTRLYDALTTWSVCLQPQTRTEHGIS